MKRTVQKKKNSRSMPRRASLFWDTDPKTIDPKKHAKYVIERILDFGTDKEVRWMWHTYPLATLRRVVETSRVLQPKTRPLWALLTSADKKKVAECQRRDTWRTKGSCFYS